MSYWTVGNHVLFHNMLSDLDAKSSKRWVQVSVTAATLSGKSSHNRLHRAKWQKLSLELPSNVWEPTKWTLCETQNSHALKNKPILNSTDT